MAGRFSRASAGLRKALSAAARRTPHVIVDALGFAGAGAFAYGAWLIYVPAGFLVGGVLLMALSMLIGRKLERATA
jgi:hypothetical protein